MLAMIAEADADTDTRYRAQQSHTCIFFGHLLEVLFIPADPLMQSHELFGQISDHFIGNVGQIENFTQRNVFDEANHPSQPLWDVDAKLGNQSAQAVEQLRSLTNQKVASPIDLLP